MKNTASKKKTCLGFLLIVFLAYVVCYLLSQTVFHEVYLFEWTAAHYYLCLWVASVTFCFLEMYRAALITTAGNWTGILIGQVLGDFIIKINATKITPDMYIGKVWQLKAHYGVLIWLLVFLLSFIIGMLRFLYKGIIINHNKKPSQPTLKRRFFKKKAAFFHGPVWERSGADFILKRKGEFF